MSALAHAAKSLLLRDFVGAFFLFRGDKTPPDPAPKTPKETAGPVAATPEERAAKARHAFAKVLDLSNRTGVSWDLVLAAANQARPTCSGTEWEKKLEEIRSRALHEKEVEEASRRFSKASPGPQTELQYVNPYTLLVAVVLSAQATDAGVNKATRKLFTDVNTPEAMLELGEEGLKQHIKTIGLFNMKARNVMAAARILVDEFGGEVPQERALLEKLPGVGRKTANVVLNVAFGRPTIAVARRTATVVVRLLRRSLGRRCPGRRHQ